MGIISPKPRERPLPSETNPDGIIEEELVAKRVEDGITELPAAAAAKTFKLRMNANDEKMMDYSDNTKHTIASLPQDPQKGIESDEKRNREQSQQVQPIDDGDNDCDDDALISRSPRPNVDMILSLKDPLYRSVMMDFFRMLGKRNNNLKSDTDSSEEAKEALILFKSRNETNEACKEDKEEVDDGATNTQVRFFKPASRYEVNGTFVEVDEKVALRKIRSDICRRMDSAKLWMNTNDKTAMSDTSDEKGSDNTMVRAPLPQVRPTAFSENEKKRKRSGNSENLPLQRVKENFNDDYNGKKTWMSREPRPNVDIVLSLKHDAYRAVMMKLYQLLGEKDDNIKNENHNDPRLGGMAMEALLLFKNRYKNEDNFAEDTATSMTKVRFFKPSMRNAKNGQLVEVDEAAALKKIRSDMSRRMDSSSSWLNAANDTSTTNSDYDNDGNDSNCPLIEKTQPPTMASAGNEMKMKRRMDEYDNNSPQSLPFLSESNLDVAEIIIKEESRAKRNSSTGSTWHYDEVVTFFRGLYVYGWNEWKCISKLVVTKKFKQVKEYAILLGRRSPVLRTFFSPMSVHMQALQLDDRIKQVEKGGVTLAIDDEFRKRNRTRNLNDVATEKDATMLATDTMKSVTGAATSMPASTMPKVVICFGEFSIDTELHSSLIQTSSDRIWQTDTLPDYFDPSVRPSFPTNSKQIFIPGNKVFARWLNKDDPGSYGSWYPGLIIGSKLSPIHCQLNLTDTPRLLYHVRFDDDAVSYDLDTEDIMMYDQYQAWLKVLDRYHSLPIPEKNPSLRLSKKTRVYAKWIDPSDPDLHGSWMAGKVVNSKAWRDENQRQWKYHIMFDNGDQDTEVKDMDVLLEDVYKSLLEERMNRGMMKMKQSDLNGLELIIEATKVSSPAKICASIESTHNNDSDDEAL